MILSIYLEPYSINILEHDKRFIFSFVLHQMMMNLDMFHVSMKFFLIYKSIQPLLSSYITMGFIYNCPIVPNNDESHITCLIILKIVVWFNLY